MCGDVLREVLGAGFYRRYSSKLADYVQLKGRYGAAVSGGVETMASIATLRFNEDCTMLSYDEGNPSIALCSRTTRATPSIACAATGFCQR